MKMSVTFEDSTNSVATALHKTIANLLQLSFVQLCQQAVSFNSSLKVLGVVCLNVDEGNDIIIKLNDTVEREGENLPVSVNGSGSRGLSEHSKQVNDGKQKLKFAISSSSTAEQSRGITKKRKTGHDDSNDYVVPPKSAHAADFTPIARSDKQANRNGSASSSSNNVLLKLINTEEERVKREASLTTADVNADVYVPRGESSGISGQSATVVQAELPVIENDLKPPRLPFGGFVRTHKGKNLPFACAECAETFDRASRLRDHANATDHLAYKCTACSAKFKSWRNVQRHAVHHLSYKPFRCGVCQKEFSRRDHAIKHIQSVHHVSPPDSVLINVMQLHLRSSDTQPEVEEDSDAIADADADVDADVGVDIDNQPEPLDADADLVASSEASPSGALATVFASDTDCELLQGAAAPSGASLDIVQSLLNSPKTASWTIGGGVSTLALTSDESTVYGKRHEQIESDTDDALSDD